jgi:hypothetical protein
MILTAAQLQPEDVRHVYCSDPRLRREILRVRRSHKSYSPHPTTTPSVVIEQTSRSPQPRPAA